MLQIQHGLVCCNLSTGTCSMLQFQHRSLYVAIAANETPKHFAGFAALGPVICCNRSIRTLFDAIAAWVRFAGFAAPNHRTPYVANTALSLEGYGFGVLTAN